ncbi:LOW QUALITY PROTEIN: hypothetical protein CVT26_008824 [Gymnopilus dilepis]|uniref:Uncharacterized protein n=1 Tax=Gymnopilus dilepis TaxID=231916 RepID=A0A409YGI8_9AGAR|nr:LOW QUALITY PROTEIN: hypothetical protein CVT26_008824 [Gymnopilus dilepis]
MSNDEVLPESYKYYWSAKSEIPLQDFLTKFKPSMVQNDGTKPWIWVRGSEPEKKDTGEEEAIKEATKLLQEVTEKVENIKNDDSIPVRSNKKTGAKSKKELREQVQNEATEKLKEISIRHGYVSGKWLIFAPAEKVDQIWSSIASALTSLGGHDDLSPRPLASLVSGPLHETPAYLAKVSTSTEEEKSNAQHLICVYLPDVYDKAAVTEVMRVLLRRHGATLSGVKSDLYTLIGMTLLQSYLASDEQAVLYQHASGIPSTVSYTSEFGCYHHSSTVFVVWKNAAVIPEKEAKDLKDAFFAELASNKSAPADTKAPDGVAAEKGNDNKAGVAPTTTKAKAKPKPKLKKKADEDFFASDDETADKKEPDASSSTATGTKRPPVDEEDEEQPKKKAAKK